MLTFSVQSMVSTLSSTCTRQLAARISIGTQMPAITRRIVAFFCSATLDIALIQQSGNTKISRIEQSYFGNISPRYGGRVVNRQNY